MANAKNSKLKSIFCGIAVALAAVLCLSVPFLLKKGNDNSSGKANAEVIKPNVTYYKHNVVLTIDTSQAMANTTAKTAFTVYDQKISEALTKDSIVKYLNTDPDLIKGIYFVTTDVNGSYQGYFTAYDKETSVVSYTTKSGNAGICPFSYVLSVEDSVTKVKGIPEQDNYYCDPLWINRGTGLSRSNVSSTDIAPREVRSSLWTDPNGLIYCSVYSTYVNNSFGIGDYSADITFSIADGLDYSKYEYVRVSFYALPLDNYKSGSLEFYIGETKINVYTSDEKDVTDGFRGSDSVHYDLKIPAESFKGTITVKALNCWGFQIVPTKVYGIKN